jgi:hypothetical protein
MALDESLFSDRSVARTDTTGQPGGAPADPFKLDDPGESEPSANPFMRHVTEAKGEPPAATGNPFMRHVEGAATAPAEGPEASPFWSGKAGRLLTGMAEPLVGTAQLAAHMTGYGAETTDKWAKDLEDFYQSQRRGAGLKQGEWDIPGGVGNALSPVNLGPAGLIGRGRTAAGIIGRGALAGGLYGATEPVHGGDFEKKKLGQVESGAVSGAIAGPVGELVSGAVDPLVGRIRQIQQAAAAAGRTLTKREEYALAVRSLNEEGVQTTSAMNWGEDARRIEDWFSKVPLGGAFVRGAEERMNVSFNRAAANRALAPLGETLPEHIQPGHEAVAYVRDRLGREFNQLHGQSTLAIDQDFAHDIQQIEANAQGRLSHGYMQDLSRIYQNAFEDKVAPLTAPTRTPGRMGGQEIHDALANTTAAINTYSQSAHPADQHLAAALHDLQTIIMDAANRHTPGAATIQQMSFTADAQFARDVARLNRAASILPPSHRAILDQLADTWVHQPIQATSQVVHAPMRVISGNDVKGVFSELANAEAGARGSDHWNERDMGHFVGEIRDALSRALERQNPGISQPLRNANEGWKNFVRVREASSKTPTQAHEGRFSPTQLGTATRGLDKSTGHTQSAVGEAPLQDLAEAGKKVMPKPMADSGTPERTLMHGLILGGAHFNPQAAALAASAPILYSETMQNLLRNYAMSGNPAKGLAARGIRSTVLPGASLGVSRDQSQGFANGGAVYKTRGAGICPQQPTRDTASPRPGPNRERGVRTSTQTPSRSSTPTLGELSQRR